MSVSRGAYTTIGADFTSIAVGYNYAWAALKGLSTMKLLQRASAFVAVICTLLRRLDRHVRSCQQQKPTATPTAHAPLPLPRRSGRGRRADPAHGLAVRRPAGSVRSVVDKPFTGDFDAMVKRRIDSRRR